MSTRESIRRELEELAKLAETMRNDPKLDARSSGEWSALDAWADDRPPTAASNPRPSSVTVPPAIHSEAPQTILASLDDPGVRGRRAPAILGMAVAFLCVVGTVATIATTVTRAQRAPASLGAAEPSPGPARPGASPPVTPLPSPPRDEPPVQTAVPVAIGSTPSLALSTSRLPAIPTSKALGHSTAVPVKQPAKKATTDAPSLDELMRKAVAVPAKGQQ
jgi:hypothetical protein